MPTEKKLDPSQIGDRAEQLKAYLNCYIIGQDEAVNQVVSGLSNYFSGLNDPNRPLVNLLFLGSTGIGKTYLVEKLAEHLLGSRKGLTYISCESYQHSHEISRLIGSPPGYLGHNDVALLSQRKLNEWRNIEDYFEQGKPKPCVILFDEIDKAHPALWKLLLGILETGKLTLNNGMTTDFTQAVIVMTANFGAKDIAKLHDGGMGFAPTKEDDISSLAVKEAKGAFSPEFFNRLDATVTFKNLTPEAVSEICECELGKVQKRVRESETPFLFSVTKAAKDALVAEGYSVKYGAREMKRVIDRRVTRSLANLIASGQAKAGSVVRIGYSDGEFIFTRRPSIIPFTLLP